MIVDSAHYKDGARQHDEALTPERAAELRRDAAERRVRLDRYPRARGRGPETPAGALRAPRARGRGRPASPISGPKIEDYDEDVFIVLKTAHYHEDREEVHFGEIHLFAGPGYVITVRHGPGSELALGPAEAGGAARPAQARGLVGRLGGARQGGRRLHPGRRCDRGRHRGGGEGRLRRRHPGPDGPHLQPEARGDRVPSGGLAAAQPARDAGAGRVRAGARGAAQLLPRRRRSRQRVDEQVSSQRELLTSVLEANLALVSVNQNEVVKKISAVAGIIAVPTFIASVYGMNFDNMPELHWHFGYAVRAGADGRLRGGAGLLLQTIDWL